MNPGIDSDQHPPQPAGLAWAYNIQEEQQDDRPDGILINVDRFSEQDHLGSICKPIVQEVETYAGTQFDPEVANAFLSLYEEGAFDNLRDE